MSSLTNPSPIGKVIRGSFFTFAAAGSYTPHTGLTKAPLLMILRIKCINASLGYSAGDEMTAAVIATDYSANAGVSLRYNAGSVKMRIGSTNLAIVDATTGAIAACTSPDFQLAVDLIMPV